MALPDGIAVREIADAGGAGLVDASVLTLYTFDGAAAQGSLDCKAGDCSRLWLALEAPEIANPAGFFSVIARDDGIAQWAFLGRPLYKFAGDRKPGDINGSGVDNRFHVALVARFFMPAGVAIRRSVELGDILMTQGGAALYQRDRVTTAAELHQFRTDHGDPALGRILGTSVCGTKCTQDRPPLVAPADAQPCGYWEIATRSDGTRQWVYKGFALYTYAADKPGDTSGNAIYDLERIGDAAPAGSGPTVPIDGDAPGTGVGAMFWRAVVP
jgi:predicted lipoprotein with Yx(FWY)xxD motif